MRSHFNMFNLFVPAEPKHPKTKWDPQNPMKESNMTYILYKIEILVTHSHFSLGIAVRRVLIREMGKEAFEDLTSQNKSQGTNDQKRLVLRTIQSYKKYIARKIQEQKHQEEEEEERERLENLCKRCGVRAHDTINLPCQCQTFCHQCATSVIKENGKCTECKARVRSFYGEDEPFRIMCSACGFVWDGNAQHACDAEERTIRVPKALPGVNTKAISTKIEETLEGWPLRKEEEFDTELYEQVYSIDLIDDWMEELALELDKEGIVLQKEDQEDDWMLVYTLQIKKGKESLFN